MTRLSRRVPPHSETNALTRRLHELQAAGVAYVDLTESNPTRVGLPYPPDLLQTLGDSRALTYAPDPFGLFAAREGIADDCLRRGAHVEPAQVVLAASTSESYSWLFKLLCDPGDAVLVPRPSYPLFDHLTRLEGVQATPYDLEYHGRWSIDFTAIECAPPNTRALLVVSPNNPTGSYVSEADLQRLLRICADRGWCLVADEVFADYSLDVTTPITDLAARADVLTFTLGGASKSLGLPQIKLGWIVVGGAVEARDAALAGLELIADTFLSVSTPVQTAAVAFLREGAAIRAAIHERVRRNLSRLRTLALAHPSCTVLRVEGGWSAVIRIPATRSEEEFVLNLLTTDRVLAHPGFFFDFPSEAYVVVSLLPLEDVFADGCARLLRRAAS